MLTTSLRITIAKNDDDGHDENAGAGKSNGDTVDDDFGGGNANDNVDDDDFEIDLCLH